MPMRSTARILAALLAATLFAGCPKSNTTVSSPSEPPADTVVATYGDGQKVTFGELNKELSEQLYNLEEQKYRMRKQNLEGLVIKRIVESEAKKRGLSEEQYFQAEIDDKVPLPPEEEMRKMYDGALAQGQIPPGTTFEQVRPRIIDILTQNPKQERARALFEELKKQNNVEIKLPEPVRPPAERKEVAAIGPAKGAEGAPITIVEFSDFQCPYCSRAIKTVDEVVAAYPGKVRLVFRHYPLPNHPQAPKASEASLCAHDQGKFWEYHDKLFANQSKLEVADLKGYAKELGLDTGKFDGCLDSNTKAALVKADMEAGSKVGVSGTPAFFINGILLSGAQPLDEFKRIIDDELKGKK